MGGRPSKPAELILLEGKSHRTKEEINFRKEAEQSLYTGEIFHESKQVSDNLIAHKEFLRLKRLYSKITYVDGLDEQIINRYCLEIANIVELQNMVDRLNDDLENAEDITQRLTLYGIINKTMSAMSKSKELLLKYEDRLFLNPTSRIKSIPKTPEKKQETSGIAAFLQRRADA